jgi:CYTH domain-containing protein
MGKEIERKFLVDRDILTSIKPDKSYSIQQGYLLNTAEKVVRVRLTNHAAFITIKGANVGAIRPEFEYSIPKDDALKMLNMCDSFIEKTRLEIEYKGHTWEVDLFGGTNEGLIVAEIELKSEDEFFFKPDWVKSEVTCDSKYYNNNLLTNPYSMW